MKKTSVYLDERQAERLKRLAEAEGRSQAEIVRDAIALYQDRGQQPPRSFTMEGIAEGPGDSVFDLSEEELLSGFGE